MSVVLVRDQEVDREVSELTNQAEAIKQAAITLDVKDEASLKSATDILGWIAKAKKQLEEKRGFFVKPLNEQVKRINEMFKSYMIPLDSADKTLRGKILSYRQEQEQKRREEEEQLRKLAEKEQKRLEKQAAKKGMPAPPPIPIPICVVQEQPKTVSGELGTVSTKQVWDFEIVDEMQLPREFLMPNEKAIRAAVKAGVRNIPGCRIYQKDELAVRAR